MIRKIYQRGSPILTQECAKVENAAEVLPIIEDLRDTLLDLKRKKTFTRGVYGLAAPQIGEAIQVSMVEDKLGRQYVLINPTITKHSDLKSKIREGCVSFLEVRGNVPRYKSVTVTALNEGGARYEITAEDPDFAMLLQHEIDHLHGVLYTDHLEGGESDLYEA